MTLISIGAIEELVIAAILLDTILGILCAIKAKKFNCSFGVNGAIRKVAMIVTVITMTFVDQITNINLVSFVPKEVLSIFMIDKVGLSDFFSILYILFETISILKSMSYLKLPVFKKANVWIENMLQKIMADSNGKEGNKDDESDCH